MRPEYALASDFTKWDAHAATCSSHELYHIIKDCLRAADCMQGWNPAKEGYYRDQAYTYQHELTKRRRNP